MRIGELARTVGVSTSAIRYYEQVGLLSPAARGPSGYREYGVEDERRLRMIVQARMLSIPLEEVKELVGLAVDGRCRTARAELETALHRRLAQTREQIRELRSLQRELETMCARLETEERPPAASPGVEECTCLDRLHVFSTAERKTTDRYESGREVHDMSDPTQPSEELAETKTAEEKGSTCGCGCMGAAAVEADKREPQE